AGAGLAGAPDVPRRGIHLHTLHPIEGYYDFWEGDPARAAQVIDWVVKNRGDHLQWVALEDALEADADWKAQQAAIVAAAHARGLTTGLGIQLYGASNLQLAFDLVDDPGSPEEERASMEPRLDTVDVGFDLWNLSFGEFSGTDPESFITSANTAYDALSARGGEVAATIHVGNYEDLRVEWEGEEMLYYFLVQFADPGITPWVHSVMFYDLYEDAGQAYHHDEFDEHRAFLEERVASGEPHGYFPETAYWVAFDNSVPQYDPLYVRSRWVDLDGLREVGTLQQHVLFSSGWEWGYWQNDVGALRMSYDRDLGWEDAFRGMFADDDVADAVIALTEVQHRWLLEGRLAAYVAGRDDFIDLGDALDIHSQPDRLEFDEVTADDQALVDDLAALAADTRGVLDTLPSGDAWVDEVRDGVEVDALRAEFAAAAWGAAVAKARGEAASASDAAAILEDARAVVTRRHAALHDPQGERLITHGDNATLYDYGYLLRADELCFWERELEQLRNHVEGADVDVRACTLE
ncbi:MAG: hypothetical protein ACOZNI_21870, partial [Myxococcota bacterium]